MAHAINRSNTEDVSLDHTAEVLLYILLQYKLCVLLPYSTIKK